METWLSEVEQKNKRKIARLITRIENGEPETDKWLETLYPKTGNAYIIGITGSPGAGKSSLLDEFIACLRRSKITVGVISIDPTSPYTGGAILGDRVRMMRHSLDEGVFIRSMGSRGSLGGLSRSARDAVTVLDAAGYDVILLETVGVGQAELDVMHVADTVCLVLNPTAGDVIQVFKAGIMEIADLFVINKADLPGVNRLEGEINDLLDLSKQDSGWRPPIVRTIATRGEGIDLWWNAAKSHLDYLKQNGELNRRRKRQLELETRNLIEETVRRYLEKVWSDPAWQKQLECLEKRNISPRTLARKWLDQLGRGICEEKVETHSFNDQR
ncbi:methylmalonyl Co-A mutase-associated GTPase MeaB [Thermoactinomyces sp. AMNI-1]|uniref:Methylmalonyl Co-A mutase-associated GTPase MeaB n=2 Tax=Thermoactinomyces mirandus TaxID=2756294 RepID=A0A7W1XTD9_9BACL|nr:methylmalonyl Co-A mutase-associated GTPase MeaB [Thermoactinomyces mirandus]